MSPRVLIADADRESLVRCRADLLAEGFTVITAISGVDCLSRLRDSEPHVLVMDPRLLWGSGEGVLEVLREGRDLPRVAVLILTDVPEALLDSPVFAGCDVMEKPAERTALSAAVRRLAMSRRRAGSILRGCQPRP